LFKWWIINKGGEGEAWEEKNERKNQKKKKQNVKSQLTEEDTF